MTIIFFFLLSVSQLSLLPGTQEREGERKARGREKGSESENGFQGKEMKVFALRRKRNQLYLVSFLDTHLMTLVLSK